MLKITDNFDDIIDGLTCKDMRYDHYHYHGRHIKVTTFLGMYNSTYYIAIDENDQILALYNYDTGVIQLKVDPDYYPSLPGRYRR